MKDRMRELKGFVAGVIFAALISGVVVMANPVAQELVFGVSISLNGEIVDFSDDMRPFSVNGRTFLSVRATAHLLGFDIGYDEKTNTVMLTSGGVIPTVLGPATMPPLPVPTHTVQPDTITVGQTLVIPKVLPRIDGFAGEPVRTHTVQPGQTLPGIAQQWYGDSGEWIRIAQANDLFTPYTIHVGQALIIPD